MCVYQTGFQLTECFLLCSFNCCFVLQVKVHSGHGYGRLPPWSIKCCFNWKFEDHVNVYVMHRQLLIFSEIFFFAGTQPAFNILNRQGGGQLETTCLDF